MVKVQYLNLIICFEILTCIIIKYITAYSPQVYFKTINLKEVCGGKTLHCTFNQTFIYSPHSEQNLNYSTIGVDRRRTRRGVFKAYRRVARLNFKKFGTLKLNCSLKKILINLYLSTYFFPMPFMYDKCTHVTILYANC